LAGGIVHQLYNLAVGQGKKDDCHTSIAKLFEEWSKTEIRSKKEG
jgi:hypothetical protein